jgi:predicted GIY-YIG superfamily endonuclease
MRCRRKLARFVYIIQSDVQTDRFYVGLAEDLDRRLAVHNSGGSTHSAKHRPWRLVACIEFANPVSATAFERYLKTGSGRAFANAPGGN